jgi:hypothetical protein
MTMTLEIDAAEAHLTGCANSTRPRSPPRSLRSSIAGGVPGQIFWEKFRRASVRDVMMSGCPDIEPRFVCRT